ncbi:MAG TPA: polyprenyl synthetase family protein [Polyangiaceae bacterium]|nr:polyprenyl synthetase family protein [Polyangiaceae bacterium]
MAARKGTRKPTSIAPRRPPAAKALAANPFLALLKTLQPDIENRLGGFLDARIEGTRSLGPEVVALAREIRRLVLRGGKRLRPALVVTGFRAASSSLELEPALDAGVALELLHTYLLIHDDWMDGDRVRRGGPAVHVALASRFGSEHKGNASAILAGDYALALACDALSRVEVRAERLRGAFSAFAEMQLGAVAGQQLDIVGRGRDVELGYALKTGSYTVEGPLRIGALLAGARPRLLTTLSRYARPAGIAFQLRDDLLSLFGDPAQTGKPLASDLTSGKRTLLLRLALKRGKAPELAALRRVVGNVSAKPKALRAALEAMRATGAPDLVERRIAEVAALALAELGDGVGSSGRALLVGATEALASRRS